LRHRAPRRAAEAARAGGERSFGRRRGIYLQTMSGTDFSRYVALGDSTTEGLDDPAPDGRGHVGFADRLAARLVRENPALLYANLAVRGRKARQVRAEQLDLALALEPDLASVVAGLNDILRPRVDLDAVSGEIEAMVTALRAQGATVLGMTFPDPARVMPAARVARARVLSFNEALRSIASARGTILIDLERYGVIDPRLWSVDRLHANTAGHRRIAGAMVQALGLEPDEDPWAPLTPPDPVHRAVTLGREAAWIGRHMTPWLIRRIRGRSSGDGISPKRPELGPVLRPDG
jgi:lysophospholipase L1-like esterase